MKTLIFAVRDNAAEAYMQLWTAPTKGAALRSFSDATNDGQSPICKHPQDHVLFQLGEYDDNTGVITPLPSPLSLGVALEYKEGRHEKAA